MTVPLGWICSLLLAAPGADPASTRPNIILMVADDLGARDLGFSGSAYHKTPELDRLAAQSQVFTQAYAACPVCSPSRAGLLTGKHPARLHLTDWLPGQPSLTSQPLRRPDDARSLPAGTPTLVQVLKEKGYATFHVGKWHLGGKGSMPTDHGFDINIGGDQTGTPRSYFAPFRSANGEAMPGLENAPEGEYLTDRLANESIRLIKDHTAKKKEAPFFLYLAHYAPHTPLKAPEDLVAKFPGKLTLGRQSNPIYAAMIASIDDGVGRLRKTLEELNLSDNTIIVFTSDNGGLCTREGPNTPATINSPLREGKGYLYEGGIRVPLLIHTAKKTPPARINVPVTGLDVGPTLAQWAGASLPAPQDGASLVSLIEGTPSPDLPPLRPLFWHYPHYSNQGGRPGAAMREGPWKLVEFFETGRHELFHLEKDSGENQNFAPDEPARVEAMAKRLEVWRKEVGAQTMTPNTDYRPNPPDENGVILLPGRSAEVTGKMLRFEPLPHKNTLGYWVVKDDAAYWEFTVEKPGKFTVELTQGCGNGSGGAELAISVNGQILKHKVVETGGFQAFKAFEIGELEITKAGKNRLDLRALSKPGPAVGDVPLIRLLPKS